MKTDVSKNHNKASILESRRLKVFFNRSCHSLAVKTILLLFMSIFPTKSMRSSLEKQCKIDIQFRNFSLDSQFDFDMLSVQFLVSNENSRLTLFYNSKIDFVTKNLMAGSHGGCSSHSASLQLSFQFFSFLFKPLSLKVSSMKANSRPKRAFVVNKNSCTSLVMLLGLNKFHTFSF